MRFKTNYKNKVKLKETKLNWNFQNKELYVCRVIYNSFERGSTNQNQGPELYVL